MDQIPIEISFEKHPVIAIPQLMDFIFLMKKNTRVFLRKSTEPNSSRRP
jgi:hypothetical protein